VNSLKSKTWFGFGKKLVVVALLLFISAGTVNFAEAWVYLILYFIPLLLIVNYFLRKDPALIERRLKGGAAAENRRRQKYIMRLLSLLFSLTLIVPGLDHRFGWSHVPAFFVVAADAAILLGIAIQFYVFKANSFASATIEVAAQQNVIATGPYELVRHPMYSGSLLVNFFIPIALGSWWGLPFALAMFFVIVLRLLDEENLLGQSLPGYEEYCRKVRHRLIPHIW